MSYFITYRNDKNEKLCLDFFTDVALFQWLGKWMAEKGSYPKNLCVFKAECIFDGS